jgi:hypothetical protein
MHYYLSSHYEQSVQEHHCCLLELCLASSQLLGIPNASSPNSKRMTLLARSLPHKKIIFLLKSVCLSASVTIWTDVIQPFDWSNRFLYVDL